MLQNYFGLLSLLACLFARFAMRFTDFFTSFSILFVRMDLLVLSTRFMFSKSLVFSGFRVIFSSVFFTMICILNSIYKNPCQTPAFGF